MNDLGFFIVACFTIWGAARLVIHGVDSLAKYIRISSFAISVFVLGILTSFSEMSVGIQSILNKTPEIFVGNLIGGSFVLLLLVIPLVAIFNKGVDLKHRMPPQKMLVFILLILSPALVSLDGKVVLGDALIVLLLYLVFVFTLQSNEHVGEQLRESIKEGDFESKKVLKGLGMILGGAVLIYAASNILVEKTLMFAGLLDISPFFISLVVIAIGTNLPEITIAVRSIAEKRSSIAIGDYIGSAATNALLFAILSLAYGSFQAHNSGFDFSFVLILLGYVLFFFFAKSKGKISSIEGSLLLCVYVVYLILNVTEISILSPAV